MKGGDYNMMKMMDLIKEDLMKRIASQPDSRCASGDEVALAACVCEIEALRKIITEVHAWIVCAAITTPADMAQNFARIEKITNPEYDEYEEVMKNAANNKLV
jgi:hypothetical protein